MQVIKPKKLIMSGHKIEKQIQEKNDDEKEYTNKVPRNFSLIALHITEKEKNLYLKILEEEWYFFNDWYKLKNEKLEKNENSQFIREFFGDNISIQAIVGKNGSGKSSVMELVYRIMNNLSAYMMQGVVTPGAAPLKYINGIYAELYFESFGVLGSVSVQGNSVVYHWGDLRYDFGNNIFLNKEHVKNATSKMKIRGTRNKKYVRDSIDEVAVNISKSFCYSLVSNYALMALNPMDYLHEEKIVLDNKKVGSWLDSLYHKNDGYFACIGFEPYKGNGLIDLERQKELCVQRLWGVLIDSLENNHLLFDNYSCESVELIFDEEYIDRKTNPPGIDLKKGGRHPLKELRRLLKKRNTFASVILESYNIDFTKYNMKDKYVLAALSYIIIKTLQIAELYPKFSKFNKVGKVEYYARLTDSFDTQYNKAENVDELTPPNETFSSKLELQKLVEEISKDKSHITLKINNTLHFLTAILKKYQHKEKNWTCSEINNFADYQISILQTLNIFSSQKKRISLDTIIENAPPPFFKRKIILKRKREDRNNVTQQVPFENLSTGERQILQSTISIIYHIRNIISVENYQQLPKYYNVNLFLDEVETCFHPAYQQKFIDFLLSMIKGQELNKKCNINIILATHSPFVLSDLPKSNILYLEDGKVPNNVNTFVNPFCANVNELLKQSFFMNTGLMGVFAKNKILSLIEYLEHKNDIELQNKHNESEHKRFWNKENAKEFIGMIGEPILKNSLMNIYNEVFGESKENLIEWHQCEIERLTEE